MREYLLPVCLCAGVLGAVLGAAGSTAAEEASQLPAGDWVAHGFSADERDELRGAFQLGIDRKGFPGGSLMLIHRGEVIFREAFGLADLASKRPFATEDLCRIASVTKPHTATLLVMLADEGRLSLDERIDKYLPEFKGMKVRGTGPARRAPTIKECLSHTGGFPGNDSLKSGALTIKRDGTLAEAVADLATRELWSEPGTQFAYGGLGYMAAARAAEVVTGKDYEVLMQEVLLDRIGAKDATFHPTDEMQEKMPTAYERVEGGFRPRQIRSIATVVNPGGGLCSTLDDVGRLMLLHRNKGVVGGRRVVSEAALAAMYVPQPGTTGPGYGLGFNTLRTAGDGRLACAGHIGGSGTLVRIDFESDLIVVLLTQVPQQQTLRWRQQLMQKIAEIAARHGR